MALVILLVPAALLLRGAGLKSALMRHLSLSPSLEHPSVTASRPNGDDGSVAVDAFVAADVRLPNAGQVIDPKTVNSGSVRLYHRGDNTVVPARVNTSAGGDAIVLRPEQPLDPNSYYRFEVLPALKDTGGASFKHYTCNFTTGGIGPVSKLPIAFEQVALPQTSDHGFTGVTTGPDGRLYACTYDGSIFRYDLNADGTIAASNEITSVKAAAHGPRLITGICFDPASTPESPILYVSHGQCTRTTADDWTGRLSRLTGPELSNYQDLLVNLPRAYRDHLNNQVAFGPDGAMYLCQGSNTAMGDPDASWGMRPERLLSASILRIDVAKLTSGTLPLDVKTDEGGTYDPRAAGAPVTIYATGLRSSYDLLFHSNGHLYATLNGSAAGGNTPANPAIGVPGLKNVRLTVPDHLVEIRPGSYHGHPNPRRGQYVLMGGNPTAAPDAVQVRRYPVGTRPEAGWTPPALEFGRNLAPCGIIEYRGSGATAALNGAMLVCRFSGGKDVCAVIPNADGSIREMITGVEGLGHLADPIDLIQHPVTGHLYVAEFAGKKLTLVRAKPGMDSARVYRQAVTPNRSPLPDVGTDVVTAGNEDPED